MTKFKVRFSNGFKGLPTFETYNKTRDAVVDYMSESGAQHAKIQTSDRIDTITQIDDCYESGFYVETTGKINPTLLNNAFNKSFK